MAGSQHSRDEVVGWFEVLWDEEEVSHGSERSSMFTVPQEDL